MTTRPKSKPESDERPPWYEGEHDTPESLEEWNRGFWQRTAEYQARPRTARQQAIRRVLDAFTKAEAEALSVGEWNHNRDAAREPDLFALFRIIRFCRMLLTRSRASDADWAILRRMAAVLEGDQAKRVEAVRMISDEFETFARLDDTAKKDTMVTLRLSLGSLEPRFQGLDLRFMQRILEDFGDNARGAAVEFCLAVGGALGIQRTDDLDADRSRALEVFRDSERKLR